MFIIRNSSDERVMQAIEDIKAGCEVMDDYKEWEDIASSSISNILDELDDDQYESTCAAFIDFIKKTGGDNRNSAYGVRAALIRAIKESIDYLDRTGSENVYDSLIAIMKDVIIKAEELFEE